MAVVRARSTPPYGMIFAMGVAVVATAAAIVFGVMWSGAAEELAASRTTLAEVGAERDIGAARSQKLLNKDDPALRQLMEQMNKMKVAIGVPAATPAENVLKDAVVAEAVTRDGSLKGAVSGLDQRLKDATRDLAQAREQVKLLTDRTTEAERRASDQMTKFETTAGDLAKQVADIQVQLAAANKARDEAVAEGEKRVGDAGSAAEAERLALVLKLEDANNQIAKHLAEIKELRIRVQGGAGADVPTVGESDGNVIRVNAAANEVFVTLTKADNIREGMTFTAYDPRVGVRYGTDEQAQGNGSMEIREVGETMSIARIVRQTPGRSIQGGDLISNLVYQKNKNRKYRFVVIGEFDLDGDGAFTSHERERLTRMIASWGGQVDSVVTAQTDYLVVGRKPASPTVVEEMPAVGAETQTAATQMGSTGAQRSSEQSQYEDVIFTARSLSVPVLNENRFLSMIGYYSTTIMRF